jgi:hypothetical protein
MKFRVFKEGLGGAQMRRCNFDSTLRTKSFQIWVEFHKFGVDQRGLETHSKCLYWANMLRFSGSCPQSVAETRWCRLFELGIRRVILRGGKNRGIDVFSNSESSSKTLLWTTHLHFESTMLIYHRTVQQPLQLDNCYCDSTRTWNENTKSHAPEKFCRLVCVVGVLWSQIHAPQLMAPATCIRSMLTARSECATWPDKLQLTLGV